MTLNSAGEKPHHGAALALDRGSVAAGCEIGGGGEVGAVTGCYRRMAKARGDAGFPDSGRADQQHVRDCCRFG